MCRCVWCIDPPLQSASIQPGGGDQQVEPPPPLGHAKNIEVFATDFPYFGMETPRAKEFLSVTSLAGSSGGSDISGISDIRPMLPVQNRSK